MKWAAWGCWLAFLACDPAGALLMLAAFAVIEICDIEI